jgi:hypothetical protein
MLASTLYPEDAENILCVLIEFNYGKNILVSGNQRQKRRIQKHS